MNGSKAGFKVSRFQSFKEFDRKAFAVSLKPCNSETLKPGF